MTEDTVRPVCSMYSAVTGRTARFLSTPGYQRLPHPPADIPEPVLYRTGPLMYADDPPNEPMDWCPSAPSLPLDPTTGMCPNTAQCIGCDLCDRNEELFHSCDSSAGSEEVVQSPLQENNESLKLRPVDYCESIFNTLDPYEGARTQWNNWIAQAMAVERDIVQPSTVTFEHCDDNRITADSLTDLLYWPDHPTVKIGDTLYGSVDAAIAAAEDGDVIHLSEGLLPYYSDISEYTAAEWRDMGNWERAMAVCSPCRIVFTG